MLTHERYCAVHRPKRAHSAARGYDRTWHKLREQILIRHGIPRARWHLYDVDHDPPYNPEVEPDHRKYRLTPMLHSEHSRKSVADNVGAFGLTPPLRKSAAPRIGRYRPVSVLDHNSGTGV